MSLQGKHALITGSSRGIGRGIALKLAEKGAEVAINYRENEAAANETLDRLRESGADGFIVQADVSRPEEVSRLFERVRREFGTLDIFVSNALGQLFDYYAPPMELSLDQWDLALDSQAKAFLVGAREAARLMPVGGRIVAVSVIGSAQTGSWLPYIAQGTAKAALESLVRYFAVALAARGITVNAVRPGWIEGSVLNALPPEVQNSIRDWNTGGWTPMGRLGTPADIGNAVALLCSEEAGWITGQAIGVDGGASLMLSVAPLEIQR